MLLELKPFFAIFNNLEDQKCVIFLKTILVSTLKFSNFVVFNDSDKFCEFCHSSSKTFK